MEAGAYVRYLESKAPVDDRSLNREVLAVLRAELAQRSDTRLDVLEIGAGTGSMVSRLLDWGVVELGDFTLVDRDLESLRAARRHLARRAGIADPGSSTALLEWEEGSATFVCGDALEFFDASGNQRSFDLVVANAVLDLMDLGPALQRILKGPSPDGFFWFTINYDGETYLLPEDPLDEQVFRLYHESMDTRVRDGKPCGDSKTGRHLLSLLPELGAQILAAGSSDWVVFPRTPGRGSRSYGGDEAYFLRFLIQTIQTALHGHPSLDVAAFDAWVAAREAQIEAGRLCYIAHQLDVLGRPA